MANGVGIGRELLAVPFPEMVESLALGIANAQLDLDRVSMRIAQMMSGNEYQEEGEGDEVITHKAERVKFGDGDYSLLELGFTPTFYQFVDTIIEVKMSISMSRSTEESRSRKTVSGKAAFGGFAFFGGGAMKVTTVSASYASKYSYSAEGSSLLRTKLVPVPPPAILEERIRLMIEGTEGGGGE